MAAAAFSLTYTSIDLDKPILSNLDTTGDTYPGNHPLGYRTKANDGREWMYVRHASGGTAAIAGGPAGWAQTTAYCVVGPVGSTGALGDGFAGTFMSVLGDGKCGWVQTKGKVLMIVSSTCAVGSSIYANVPAGCSTVSGQTGVPCAISLEAATAGTFPNVMLKDK